METIERLLREYKIQPSKNFGQNFLHDQRVLRREIQCAKITREDDVLEIGPGLGSLTRFLAESARKVFAVEQDLRFTGALNDLRAAHGNVEIIWEDALKALLPKFSKVVSNLPYRMAMPILFRLLDLEFETGVLIVQRSQAEKLCARPGKPGYGRISVAVQRHADFEYLETVHPKAFYPPPQVDSAIIALRKISPRYNVPSEDFFRRTLDFLFLERGKPLRMRLLSLAGIADQNKRVGEALSMLSDLRDKEIANIAPAEFGRICVALKKKELQLPYCSPHKKRRGQQPR